MNRFRAAAALLSLAALSLPGPACAQAPAFTPPAVLPGGFSLKWAADPLRGLKNFETVEDDRANSHPGVRHIYVTGGIFHVDIHLVDRDYSTDRQRNEFTGMNVPGQGDLHFLQGETWLMIYEMYIPNTLTGGSRFDHIHQMKMVTDAGSSGGPPVTLSTAGGNTVLPRAIGDFKAVPLSQIWDKWVEVQFEDKCDLASNGGYVRWTVRLNGEVITDQTVKGDVWHNEGTRNRRIRPKWGIYRSLGSDGLKDSYILFRNMRAYKKDAGP
jgi:hypothetical protein